MIVKECGWLCDLGSPHFTEWKQSSFSGLWRTPSLICLKCKLQIILRIRMSLHFWTWSMRSGNRFLRENSLEQMCNMPALWRHEYKIFTRIHFNSASPPPLYSVHFLSLLFTRMSLRKWQKLMKFYCHVRFCICWRLLSVLWDTFDGIYSPNPEWFHSK